MERCTLTPFIQFVIGDMASSMSMPCALGFAAIAWLLGGCETLPMPSSLPLSPLTRRSQPPPLTPSQSSDTADMEKQVWEQINTIRQQQGLSTLTYNEELAQVARDYSRRMTEQGFFSHTGPDGDTMVSRVESAGIFYLTLGENLFTSTNITEPVPAAVEGWMNSPGHRENILRAEYRETGIGIWREGTTYYFTQLFMRSL